MVNAVKSYEKQEPFKKKALLSLIDFFCVSNSCLINGHAKNI